MPKTDMVYSNKRGETVIPYAVFKQLSFDAIWKVVAPKKR